MYETLLRPHEVSQVSAPLPIGDVAERLRKAEIKREEKRQRQIENNGRQNNKRKRDTSEVGDVADTDTSKRAKTEAESVATPDIVAADTVDPEVQLEDELSRPSSAPDNLMDSSRVLTEVRGHTSYLTFACLVPDKSAIPSDEAPTASPDDTP
jgi:tRNA (adenine57-N1/adenine58-N1)-methyltransferase catalytic subunit